MTGEWKTVPPRDLKKRSFEIENYKKVQLMLWCPRGTPAQQAYWLLSNLSTAFMPEAFKLDCRLSTGICSGQRTREQVHACSRTGVTEMARSLSRMSHQVLCKIMFPFPQVVLITAQLKEGFRYITTPPSTGKRKLNMPLRQTRECHSLLSLAVCL